MLALTGGLFNTFYYLIIFTITGYTKFHLDTTLISQLYYFTGHNSATARGKQKIVNSEQEGEGV